MTGAHKGPLGERIGLRCCAAAAVLALCSLPASPAYARDGPPVETPEKPPARPPDRPASEVRSADIVVTAQKRAQKINDVGMAITAATGRELIERNVTSLPHLTRIEPSLQFSQSNNGTPVYTIRGVGYFEQSLAATPTVSVYQDEIAFAYPIMTRGALLDLERVEVLKGPQGTYYGQNATGGALNFIAAKPTEQLSAGGDATYARFGEVDISGFVSGPLARGLSARLAVRFNGGGAWQRSNTRDEKHGRADTRVARLLLSWKPGSGSSLLLNVNGWTDRSDTQAGQLEGFYFQSPNFISALTPASTAPSQPYSQYPQHIRDLLANPVSPADPRAADWVAGTRPRNDETFHQVSLRADHSFSPALRMTSLSNYQEYDQKDLRDLAGVNTTNVSGIFYGTVKTYSQEVRLHGLLDDDRVNWMAGGNIDFTRTYELDDLDFFGSASYLTGGSPQSALPTSAGFGPFTDFQALNRVRARTYSVFANVDYDPTRSLGLHAGIRYTKSNLHTEGCAISSHEGLNVIINSVSAALGGTGASAGPGLCNTLGPDNNAGLQRNVLKQSNVPWRVGVDWKPRPDNLIYFTISRGYKAGASPALGASSYKQLIPVTQESLLAYELGAKLSFFTGRLRANMAFFHYDYTDKQFLGRTPDPIFTTLQTLVNIPKSRVDGAELSLSWQPVRRLRLDGAATYLNSKVTSDFINYASYVTSQTDTINLKGEAFPFTPKWTLHYGARYQWRLKGGMSAFLRLGGSYQTRTVAAFGAAHAATRGPPLDIPGYGLLDLSAGLESADRHWQAVIWGKNVTNTYYWTTVFYEADTTLRNAGRPATYGLTLSYRY